MFCCKVTIFVISEFIFVDFVVKLRSFRDLLRRCNGLDRIVDSICSNDRK